MITRTRLTGAPTGEGTLSTEKIKARIDAMFVQTPDPDPHRRDPALPTMDAPA
ncbi:hypothetical protein [Rhodococcus jostii]|uniref:hypothetical protein n=1 Tax=Rhodococcus jostii TaxID=132919 RepID=UPI0013C2AE99|nr:hypothetical protein [Rhodococcus jostii]